MKTTFRRMFYRSSMARWILGIVSVMTRRTKPLGSCHLLTYTEEDAIGPLQQTEALLLFSLVKTTLPSTILEFGFYHGHSAFNFLQAIGPESHLFCFDIDPESKKIAAQEFPRDPRFHFVFKSQADFSPSDVQNRPIDLVFFDASHDFATNQKTFVAVEPCLSPTGIVCIHDTELWNKKHFLPVHEAFARESGFGAWLSEQEFAHQLEERIFVNWILQEYPEFQSIHLHSDKTLRHGLSLLQRTRELNSQIKEKEA